MDTHSNPIEGFAHAGRGIGHDHAQGAVALWAARALATAYVIEPGDTLPRELLDLLPET